MDSPTNSDMDLSVDEMKQIMDKCIAEVSKQSRKKSAKIFPNARRLLFATKLERDLAPPPVKSGGSYFRYIETLADNILKPNHVHLHVFLLRLLVPQHPRKKPSSP